MKNNSTKINMEGHNKKKILIAGIIILILLLLIILLEINGVNIISNKIRTNNRTIVSTKTIAEYEIMKKDTTTNELEILVTIENEKGIEIIEIEDFVINSRGKKKVSFDRKLVEDSITNIKVKPINGEEENLVLVPTMQATGLIRTTEMKKGEGNWEKKIELLAVDKNTPTYYSVDEGENWELLLEEGNVVYNVETEKIKFNKKNNEIWEVRKKKNTNIYGYDTVTKLIEDIVDESGYYKALVQSEQIDIHAYVQNEDLEISETTQYGDANDVGTANAYAKNMIVLKVNGNLTVKENAKLTTYGTEYGGPKGIYIYTTGNLENNGEISMTARGAKAVGQNVYLYNNNDGTYEYVPKLGASGGVMVRDPNSPYQTQTNGSNGKTGTNRQTGGGASGGNGRFTEIGSGAQGTSYSGGSGSGGACGQSGDYVARTKAASSFRWKWFRWKLVLKC